MVSSTFHAHRNSPNSNVLLSFTETDSSLRHSILLHRCPVNEFDLELGPSLITRAIIVSTGCSAISVFKIFSRRYRDTDRSTLTRCWSNNSSLSSLFFRLSPLPTPPKKVLHHPLRISSIRQLNTRHFASPLGKGIQRNDSFGFLCNELQSSWCNFTECIVPGQLSKFKGPVESPRAERRRSGLVKLRH